MYRLIVQHRLMHRKFRFPKMLLLAALLTFVSAAGTAQVYKHYYGNIHSHTSYSDGCGDEDESGVSTPAQAFEFAKQAEHFDFLGISEHNHSKAGMKDKVNYQKGIAEAKAANRDGKFVCLYGMEFGTNEAGHVLIYGVEELINWEENIADVVCVRDDYQAVWEYAAGKPNTFATLAHPGTKHYGDLLNGEYNETADVLISGTAVRNGPHSAKTLNYDNPPAEGSNYFGYYRRMLAAGYKLGPTIDHDNHYTTFGRTSQGRTVVLAKSLTKKNIIDAYRAMRFYASDDWNVKVDYAIDGKPMGSELTAGEVRLEVAVTDADEEDGIAEIRVMYGTRGSRVNGKELLVESGSSFAYDIEILPDEDIYIYLEIEQVDGDKIFTSPIWVKGS